MNASIKRVALSRIEILFKLALETNKSDSVIAQRYVKIARKIAMAVRIKLPIRFSRYLCKGCGNLVPPGFYSRVRLKQRRKPHIVITCLKCGNCIRIPYGKSEKSL